MDDYVSVEIPKSTENLSLPMPQLVTYYKNLENRVLWLDAEVDDDYFEFVRNIIEWNREDFGKPVEERKTITIMINTLGGELSVCNSVIDTIKLSKTPVRSVNMGCCFSAGCFLYMACKERYTMPRSTFLIHNGSGGFEGSFKQVMSQIEEYSRQVDELVNYLRESTSIPEELVTENINSEWYLSAEDAMKYGVATKIITSLDDLF